MLWGYMLDYGFTAKYVAHFYAPFSKINKEWTLKIWSDYSPVRVLGVKQLGPDV